MKNNEIVYDTMYLDKTYSTSNHRSIIYVYCQPPQELLVKATVYVTLPVLYAMQKSSLAQLWLADGLLLTSIWWVMTVLLNTAPDPGQRVQPSSHAPKLRGHQNYNKHI
jgi:hypothetical protein